MRMPKPDASVLVRRKEIVEALRAIVPGEGRDRRAGRAEGLRDRRAHRLPPAADAGRAAGDDGAGRRGAGLLPRNGVKVVPRGAGTSLSGGALPLADGILLGLGKFNRILEIDYDNRCVVAQPGVTNLAISNAVAERGFYYAPDPSSQIACSIGGNVAENSGGVHCLKYGLTTNNLLGVEMVLINGEVVRLGGKHLDGEGYDLLGVVTGSEGLLGVVTEVTVRIIRKPETARALLVGFPTAQAAGGCVADVIGAGIIPGGMEMMDRPAIHAAEDFLHAGYPLDVEALLIVELDGPEPEVEHLIARVEDIARAGRRRQRQGQRQRGGAAEVLGRPQGRVPRRRPDQPRLPLHGRDDPAPPAGRRAQPHPGAFGAIRAALLPTSFTPATAICIR